MEIDPKSASTGEGGEGTLNTTFELNREITTNEGEDYEEKRAALKLGYWKSAVLLFQGTVGLSMFTLQKPLAMVGLYWGFILTIIIGYITCYGLVRLSNLSAEIETDLRMKRKIKNFDELTRNIEGKHVPFIKGLMMFAAVMMMYSSTVSNILLITMNLNSHLGLNEDLIKAIIFVVITFMLLFMVEPEKIQYINLYMTLLLISVAYILFAKNTYIAVTGNGPKFEDIPKVGWKATGVYSGNVAYAFEVASNYLSLRLTSSIDVNYSALTSTLMVFIGLNFYICAAANLFAYAPNKVTENALEMHAKSGIFWQYLIYAFMVNTLYTFTFNTHRVNTRHRRQDLRRQGRVRQEEAHRHSNRSLGSCCGDIHGRQEHHHDP